MFKGSFPAFTFYKVGAICAVLSLVIIYYQSQYYHHEPPFPKRTISQVAQHYPEFVIFRLSTITGSALIVLGWLTNYFFLKTFTRDHQINLRKFHPKISLTMGVTAGILLMFSTGLIDTGIMNELFHGICATSFFILTFAAQVYNAIICIYLQKESNNGLSQWNMYLKYAILVLLALQLIDSSINGIGIADIFGGEDNSDKSNFFEWTLTATVISMFLSIGLDANKYELVYS